MESEQGSQTGEEGAERRDCRAVGGLYCVGFSVGRFGLGRVCLHSRATPPAPLPSLAGEPRGHWGLGGEGRGGGGGGAGGGGGGGGWRGWRGWRVGWEVLR